MGVMRVGNAYDYKMVWRKPRDMYTLVTMIIQKKKRPVWLVPLRVKEQEFRSWIGFH